MVRVEESICVIVLGVWVVSFLPGCQKGPANSDGNASGGADAMGETESAPRTSGGTSGKDAGGETSGTEAGEGGGTSGTDAGGVTSGTESGEGGTDASTGSGGSGGSDTSGGTGSAGDGGSVTMGAGGSGGESSDLLVNLVLEGPIEADADPILLDGASLRDSVDPGFTAEFQHCSDGSFLVRQGGQSVISKLSPTLVNEWTLTAERMTELGISTTNIVLTDDCEAVLGGTLAFGTVTFPITGAADAWVAKIDSAGELAWRHQWGSSGAESTESVTVLEDGSILATGPCSGQVPGGPAALSGRPFVAFYSADGDQTSLVQFETAGAFPPILGISTHPDGFFQLGIDGSGGTALQFRGDDGAPEAPVRIEGILSVSADGERRIGLWPIIAANYNASEEAFFAINQTGAAPPADENNPLAFGVLARFTESARMTWIRHPEPWEVEIEPVEGVIWQGSFLEYTQLLVADDALYLLGKYSNQYENGSIVRPSTRTAFIGRYAFDGERIWFQQFLLDQAPESDTPASPLSIAGAVSDATVHVFLRGPVPNQVPDSWYAIDLDAETGDPL